MAKELTFKLSGADYSAAPMKLERKKDLRLDRYRCDRPGRGCVPVGIPVS